MSVGMDVITGGQMLCISESVPVPEESYCWALSSLEGLRETTGTGTCPSLAWGRCPLAAASAWSPALVPDGDSGAWAQAWWQSFFLPRSPSVSWPGSHDISVCLLMGHFEMTLTLLLANRNPLQTDSYFLAMRQEAWTLGKGEAGLWGTQSWL